MMLKFLPLSFLLATISIFQPVAVRAQEAAQKFASAIGAQKVATTFNGAPLCNAPAFAQVPGQPSAFIGRMRQGALKGVCAGGDWTLALFKMNSSGDGLTVVHTILNLPDIIHDGGSLVGALDPYIALYHGRYFIAFECHVSYEGKRPGVEVCIGPYDPKQGIVANGITVLAADQDVFPHTPYFYAALSPKLFTFRDHLYLYWSTPQIDRKTNRWQHITSRGMELTVSPNGLVWGKGSHQTAVAAADPNLTVEVLGVGQNDPLYDRVADTSGIYPTNRGIYVTAALGGGYSKDGSEFCIKPSSPVASCYRIGLFFASLPLAQDALNHTQLQPTFGNGQFLPKNAGEYTRIFDDGRGGHYLMGKYHGPDDPSAEGFLPDGFWRYPLQLPQVNQPDTKHHFR